MGIVTSCVVIPDFVDRDTSLEDNSDNSIPTETESEKRQTETLTKQLSAARIGDEDGLFQKGPIRMPSGLFLCIMLIIS